MVHVRQLGFFAGIFLSIWLYTLNFARAEQGKIYIWVAPFFILLILIVLALRRSWASSDKKVEFSALIRAALGVVVIAVVIFNIAAYIYFKWVSPGDKPPFQAALFMSWAVLALGMVVSLATSFIFYMLPKRKM